MHHVIMSSLPAYMLRKFGGVTFRLVLERLHVMEQSCLKLLFAEAKVIFGHIIVNNTLLSAASARKARRLSALERI